MFPVTRWGLLRKARLLLSRMATAGYVIPGTFLSFRRIPCMKSVPWRNLLVGAPENPFPVEELSRRVFVSQYYLIREFKKRFGLTPHQYQMQNRVRKAQHLLLEGRSIAEVALITGFCDQSHFDRWFRKMLGITPSDYIEAQIRLPDRD